MINISYMKEYVTLAETLNFTKTAEQLYTAQPAVSRHITAIEEEFGAKLFVRDTRNVRLTEAGELVYDCFREFLDKYAHTEAKVSALQSGQSGKLVVSSPYYWTEDFTEPVAARFMEKYPDCELKILSCQPQDGMVDMQKGVSDLALYAESVTIGDNIRRFSFAHEPVGIIMPADHPSAGKEHVKLQEFQNDPFVFLSAEEPTFIPFNNHLLSCLQREEVHPKDIVYTQQVDTIGLTIKQTGGVCIMPYALRNLNREYLWTAILDDIGFDLAMCFYYKMDNENPAIPLFLQTCREVYEKPDRS